MRTLMLALLSLLLIPSLAWAQADTPMACPFDFTVTNGLSSRWQILNGVGPYTSAPSGISSVYAMGTELVEIVLEMKGARFYGINLQYSASLAHDVAVFAESEDGSQSYRIFWRPMLVGGDHTIEDFGSSDEARIRVVIYNSTLLAGTEHFQIKRVTIVHSGPSACVFQPVDTYSVDVNGLYDSLNEGSDRLNDLPTDLTRPNGVNILPAESGDSLFRYVKWIINPSSADEIAGPFAPAITHLGMGLNIMFILSAVYIIVYVAIYLIRFAVWLFKIVIAVVQTIIGAIGALLNFLPF